MGHPMEPDLYAATARVRAALEAHAAMARDDEPFTVAGLEAVALYPSDVRRLLVSVTDGR